MFGFRNTKVIHVNDLKEKLGKIELIDIREPYEYANGHLPTAKSIPMSKILNAPEKFLDKNKEYHIICQSGGRSSMTCEQLKKQGYNTINVAGGTGSYIGGLER